MPLENQLAILCPGLLVNEALIKLLNELKFKIFPVCISKFAGILLAQERKVCSDKR